MTPELEIAWEKAMSVKSPKEVIGMDYIGTVKCRNRFYKFFHDKEKNEYWFWTWVE